MSRQTAIRGLPPLDLPLHLQEPDSCRRCVHSFFSADDKARRHLRCGRSEHSEQCCYERHDTGDCKSEARFFKARGNE